MVTQEQPISAEFPYESNYIEVHGSKMHYIESGAGDPILFLHGNPTSSYLWRNVIPHVSDHGRCIAPDLIGMGKSDKPDLNYRFVDHARYIEGFIDAMGLDKFTLVIHDWGSGLGFDYAMRNPERIKGIAFMEAIIKPARWSEFPPEFRVGFKLFRTPGIGWLMVSVLNVFVKQILPQAVVRKLTKRERDFYEAPFPTVQSRKPVRVWPQEIPIEGKPADVQAIVQTYCDRLQQSDIPKLLLYATPGAIVGSELVQWCQDHLPNLTTIHIGEGIHYVQEDHPLTIGKKIAEWYKTLA